jgi:cell shape-determining protein MreC
MYYNNLEKQEKGIQMYNTDDLNYEERQIIQDYKDDQRELEKREEEEEALEEEMNEIRRIQEKYNA